MEKLTELIGWLQEYTVALANGSGTTLGKAGVMSELVFDTLEEINQWPLEQQQQAIEHIRRWLDGTVNSAIALQHDTHTEKWIKPILRGVIDKASAMQ